MDSFSTSNNVYLGLEMMRKINQPFYGVLPDIPAKKYPVKKVGDRFEAYRLFLGLQGQEFAAHLNISQGSYSDIANNKSLPSCNTIVNLYQVEENLSTIKWILTGKES